MKILRSLKSTVGEFGRIVVSVSLRLSFGAVVVVLVVSANGWVAATVPLSGGACEEASPSFGTLFSAESGQESHPWMPCAYAWQAMTYLAVFVGSAFFTINTDILKNWMQKKWLYGARGLRSVYPGAGEKRYTFITEMIDDFVLRTSQYTSSVLPWLFVYFGLLLLYPNRYVPWTELLLLLLLTLIPFFILYKFDGDIERKISIWHEADRDGTSSAADATITQEPDTDDEEEG